MIAATLGPYSEACADAFSLLELPPEARQRMIDINPLTSDFTPIGQVALGGEDILVHAGLKTRSFDYVARVAREMYLGDRLLSHLPERFDSLPLFTLPVIDDEGNHLGILTEDYTQDGTRELIERREYFRPIGVRREEVPEGLYVDVYDAMEGRVYSEAFSHMLGYVGHREVMVDFDDVTSARDKELEEYFALAQDISVRVGPNPISQ